MIPGTSETVDMAQLRRHSVRHRQRSPEQLIALAESWLALPVHPIVVRPSTGEPPMFDVADGNSRLDGLELLGVTAAKVFVTEATLTDDELDTIGFITAFHRENLACSEQAQIVIRKRKAGMANNAIAKTLGIHEGYASKLAKLDACRPEVQEAARAGLIGANEWALIAKADDQLSALDVALNGNREALQQAVKPARNGAAQNDSPKEKTARVKIPLAVTSDVYDAAGVVTIASLPGREIDFEEVENLLKEALKAVKDAVKRKLTIKTFQSEMKDIATPADAMASA